MAGDADQEVRQIPVADRCIAPDVEDVAVTHVCRAGAQKGIGGVVDIDEIAHLRSIAEDLDLTPSSARRMNHPMNPCRLCLISWRGP